MMARAMMSCIQVLLGGFVIVLLPAKSQGEFSKSSIAH